MYSKYIKGINILIKQIDTCNESEWEERELYWIKYYKNLGFKLMNLDKGGKGVITKEKRSQSSIERSIKGHEIAVIALNLDGTFYKEFESATKASKEFGLKRATSISNVLQKRSKSAHGYIWVYKKDYDTNKSYSYSRNTNGKSFYQFNIDGILIKKWNTYTELNKLQGWSYNSIKNAIKNKKIYHDSYWSDSDSIDISKYEQYYKYQLKSINDKEVLKFKSQSAICKYLKLAASTVSLAIKHKTILNKKYLIELL